MGQHGLQEERNAESVRRYLRVFASRDLEELRAVMAGDVEIYGAGATVRGREYVEQAVCAHGLTVVAQELIELHACGDRVVAVVALTYRCPAILSASIDASGRS